MAYSKKVIDKFESTLNEPEKIVLVDGTLLMLILVQEWLERLRAEM